MRDAVILTRDSWIFLPEGMKIEDEIKEAQPNE